MISSNETYYCADIGDGSPSHPWCLLEISGNGARLLVDRPDDVPDRFTLVQKAPIARIWKCRVVWRSPSHVGVEIEGNFAPAE